MKTVDVAPFTRKTVYAGDYDELKGRAFGIVVDATEPVIAERAMYFATQPGKLWAGGHVNTGIVAPSRSWFHAEGATGTFFNTFILLSNPQDTEAKVDVRFLLDNGTVIKRPKTLGPQQRLTINPATRRSAAGERRGVDGRAVGRADRVGAFDVLAGDAKRRLAKATTAAASRKRACAGASPKAASAAIGCSTLHPAGESVGGDGERAHHVSARERRADRQDKVPATSRFNMDVKTVVPELQNSSFGAIIEVLNDVPIAVERSLYWNANGAFWAGGTNALATPLPPIE